MFTWTLNIFDIVFINIFDTRLRIHVLEMFVIYVWLHGCIFNNFFIHDRFSPYFSLRIKSLPTNSLTHHLPMAHGALCYYHDITLSQDF